MSVCVVQASSFVERLEQKMTLDELVRLTRPLTLATAKAVAAGNSGHQDDIIAAANMGRKAVSDLLRGCRVRVIWFINFVAVMHHVTFHLPPAFPIISLPLFVPGQNFYDKWRRFL